ncbi:uncharacterized protein LOC116287987 [Actinia tenebrosa]|uniref:Uncharacterized protein LOC116287987 n=1 Tax=Actinia tenebrosa TaxID=6105 RepID=A0A6P8H528_ACTTE|nr:uncharacterized protein LOC116287987 [Actinia tenebrosa]
MAWLTYFSSFILENNEYDDALPTPAASPKPFSQPSTRRKFSIPTTFPGQVRRTGKPTGKQDNQSLMIKFIKFLFTSAKSENNPDLKYEQPGKELVSKLFEVKKATIGLSKPLMKYGKLLLEDFIDMIKKVDKAVKNNNIFQAKHLVGEYFIAVNRRFASIFIHAASSGLFDLKSGNDSIVEVKREFDEHSKKAKSIVGYILKNFNQFRVSDGIPDGPFVKLGVQTAKIYILAFQQSIKMAKVESSMIIDMIADMVRLGVDMKNREAAVQRAAASILSMVRRQTKINVAVERAYSVKKCYNPRPRDVDEDDADLQNI